MTKSDLNSVTSLPPLAKMIGQFWIKRIGFHGYMNY